MALFGSSAWSKASARFVTKNGRAAGTRQSRIDGSATEWNPLRADRLGREWRKPRSLNGAAAAKIF